MIKWYPVLFYFYVPFSFYGVIFIKIYGLTSVYLYFLYFMIAPLHQYVQVSQNICPIGRRCRLNSIAKDMAKICHVEKGHQ